MPRTRLLVLLFGVALLTTGMARHRHARHADLDSKRIQENRRAELDLKKIQGAWEVVSVERGGVLDFVPVGSLLTFTGDRVALQPLVVQAAAWDLS